MRHTLGCTLTLLLMYPDAVASNLIIATSDQQARQSSVSATASRKESALERVDSSVMNKNPRLVILLLGDNDFLRQVPTGETRQNLKEIVRQLQAHGAMVAIAGIKLGFLY